MDRWLAAIEADQSNDPIAVKVIRDRPADIVNSCWIAGVQTIDLALCDSTYPHFREPRTVAGDGPTIYTMKCQLKPLVRTDYAVSFTNDQWAALQATFPTGVCDFSKPGVGFQANVPWLSYENGPGGVALPDAPSSKPGDGGK